MSSENPSSSTSSEDDMQPPRGAEGRSSIERPRKRKKTSYKSRIFRLEEKERLKKYETWESQTRLIANRTNEKLAEDLSRAGGKQEIKYLKKRLNTLMDKTSLGSICVGFFGKTGAGKSSLLNAILEKKLFLPVSGSSSCTSCLVQIKTSPADQYEATIHLLSDDDWKKELKNLMKILKNNGKDVDGELVKDAQEKLCCVYGKRAKEKDYETLLKTKLKVDIPARRKITVRAQKAEDLSEKLDPYLRVGNEDDDNLWPLISYIDVTLPGSEMPPEGIVLLDIPGTGDFNKKRDEMWKQSINKCSVIWIVSAFERVKGEKIQNVLLQEGIKAFTGGVCTDIALVVTKSDDIKLDEYRRERKNKNFPIQNEHDAILERNQDVKNEKETIIKEKLRKTLPPNAEVFNKPKLVYTVSTKEFWEPVHLKKKETEIPELREYIRKLYLKGKQKLVMDYVVEVLSVHKIAKNFSSEPQIEDQVFQQSGVKELMMRDIDSLEDDLQTSFDKLKKRLCKGVDCARKKYKIIVGNLITVRKIKYSPF